MFSESIKWIVLRQVTAERTKLTVDFFIIDRLLELKYSKECVMLKGRNLATSTKCKSEVIRMNWMRKVLVQHLESFC